ncbi:hypothetical protein BC940DRAFT_334149 [Gongronella butleri]|nr:hypothetical protein BC940DRAFT_334149 [Gongronella butleri]
MVYSVPTFLLLLIVLCLNSVQGQGLCQAQANFDGCQQIQKARLSTCGPVDYTCQCAAQQLIQECYNLCPSYAAEAMTQEGTMKAICAAVPVVSSASVATLLPSATASAANATSASPTGQATASSSTHSRASRVSAVGACLGMAVATVLYLIC